MRSPFFTKVEKWANYYDLKRYRWADGDVEPTGLCRRKSRNVGINALNCIRRGEVWCYMQRGFTWMDTGTPERLLDAADFVRSVQKRHATIIAALEEIAYRQDWISAQTLQAAGEAAVNTDYGQHLLRIAHEITVIHG